MLIVDSFAWIEFFKGTEKGKKVLNHLKNSEGSVATTAANYYEVYYRITQDAGAVKREEALKVIRNVAMIVPINEELAAIAGEIRLRKGLSAVDSFTLAAAKKFGGKVLTGDKHFAGLEEALLL